jgi:hypothetical protein
MAEDNVATNGHRPPRRQRKHIYPPPAQMAAEQAAAGARPRTVRAVRLRAADSAFGPEAETPPAPPVLTAVAPDEAPEMTMTPAVDEDGASLDGERVELRLSAVGMVDAGDVSFAQGALGAARAGTVTVEQGALGVALADNVTVSRGYARSILARQVQLDNAAARLVVAADVKADRTAIMFLIARRVSGDVRVLLDWRGAVAFGAVAGLVMGLLRRVSRSAGKGSR